MRRNQIKRVAALFGYVAVVCLTTRRPAAAQDLVTERVFEPVGPTTPALTGERAAAKAATTGVLPFTGLPSNTGEFGGSLERATRLEAARHTPITATPRTGAAAQGPGASLASALTIGSRVRVLSTVRQARVQGTVVAVDERIVTLAGDGQAVRIPVESIAAVEVNVGSTRQWLWGLIGGTAAGVGVGLGAGIDPSDCGMDSVNFCSRGDAVGTGAIGFGLIGLGVGTAIKRDRWFPITVPPQPLAAAGAASAQIPVALKAPEPDGTRPAVPIGEAVALPTEPVTVAAPPARLTVTGGVGNAMGDTGAQAEWYLLGGRLSVFGGLGADVFYRDPAALFAGGLRAFTPGTRNRAFVEFSVSHLLSYPERSYPDLSKYYGPGVQVGYQLVLDDGFTFVCSLGAGYALGLPGTNSYGYRPKALAPMGGLGVGYTWRRQ